MHTFWDNLHNIKQPKKHTCIRADCKYHTYEKKGCKKYNDIQNCIAKKEKYIEKNKNNNIQTR